MDQHLLSIVFTSHLFQVSVWLLLGVILAASLVMSVVAVKRPWPAGVFVSGLLLSAAGVIAWVACGPYTVHALLQVNVVSLSLAGLSWTLLDRFPIVRVPHVERAGGRTIRFGHLATVLAVGMLGLAVVAGVARCLTSLPPAGLTVLDWIALGSATGAVVALLWDPAARFPLAALYGLGLAALGMMEMARGLSPGLFFLWGGFSVWAAFVIIAALVGWALPKFRRVPVWLRIPTRSVSFDVAAARVSAGNRNLALHSRAQELPRNSALESQATEIATSKSVSDQSVAPLAHAADYQSRARFTRDWFNLAQAFVAVSTAVVTAWVSLDFAFNRMGEELDAVFMTGRGAACPTALMLLGGAILMAWQTRGAWRATWQFAAMIAGVLLTSSLGWASLDGESQASLARDLWWHRSVTFMTSTGMMAFMTSIGLRRILPRASDWIARGRQAMPVFGGLFLLTVIAVLIQAL